MNKKTIQESNPEKSSKNKKSTIQDSIEKAYQEVSQWPEWKIREMEHYFSKGRWSPKNKKTPSSSRLGETTPESAANENPVSDVI